MREFPLDTGEADYLLFVDQKAAGIVEAKPAGVTLRAETPPAPAWATARNGRYGRASGAPVDVARTDRAGIPVPVEKFTLLEHAAIDQHLGPVGAEVVLRAGHLAGGAEELKVSWCKSRLSRGDGPLLCQTLFYLRFGGTFKPNRGKGGSSGASPTSVSSRIVVGLRSARPTLRGSPQWKLLRRNAHRGHENQNVVPHLPLRRRIAEELRRVIRAKDLDAVEVVQPAPQPSDRRVGLHEVLRGAREGSR